MKVKEYRDEDRGCTYFKNKYNQDHKDDGPAIIWDNGILEWKRNNRYHRKDGSAYFNPNTKEEYWYINGKYHRDDGPAIIAADGTKYWYFEGKHHRDDGPAVIGHDGYCEFWIDDRLHNKIDEWFKHCNWWRRRIVKKPKLNKEQLTILKLQYG